MLVGSFEPAGEGGTGIATSTDGLGTAGASPTCEPTQCQGKTYLCGNCKDDDGDSLIDALDPDCLGPCDNAEDSYYGSIPGQSGGGCRKDCYFDDDSGGGNDQCEWDLSCDPLAASSDLPPGNGLCQGGSPSNNCDTLSASQSDTCLDVCLPLTPNGCDCFGCCAIGDKTVYLGSEVNGEGSCTRKTLDDPESCKPCTQVEACLNPCEECELCVGKHELPEGCGSGDQTTPECPTDSQACGVEGLTQCPLDYYCITGCCHLTIR